MKCKQCEICEICEIIFTKGERNGEVIERGKVVIKIVLQTDYNSQSTINEKRCESCLNIEEKIKYECGMCGYSISNNLNYFKQYGNVCRGCITKINRIIDDKKDERTKV